MKYTIESCRKVASRHAIAPGLAKIARGRALTAKQRAARAKAVVAQSVEVARLMTKDGFTVYPTAITAVTYTA